MAEWKVERNRENRKCKIADGKNQHTLISVELLQNFLDTNDGFACHQVSAQSII
jgi:hypothetical protein